MHDGVIEQIGTPLELYDHPDNLFVAQFIGSPAMNVVNGTLRRNAGGAFVEAAGGIRWPLAAAGNGKDGEAVVYGIRPEHLSLAVTDAAHAVTAEVTVVEPTGAETELHVRAGDAEIVVVASGRTNAKPGDKIGVIPDLSLVHLFDQASGRRL
jgi:multiple sugar transport system ATP-binding protein